MQKVKTKIIYSLRLSQFLLDHKCTLVEIIQNPFKVGYKAWKFVDDDLLQDSIAKFMEGRES